MWMLWPFDDGSGVSLHGAKQFDRGLLPHGVRPQGNHEVRHLRDFIQVIRPLKHHFFDLEGGKWCRVDVCDTVYMSRHTGSQRCLSGLEWSDDTERKHPLISKRNRLCFLHTTDMWRGTRRWIPSNGFSFFSSTLPNITVFTCLQWTFWLFFCFFGVFFGSEWGSFDIWQAWK